MYLQSSFLCKIILCLQGDQKINSLAVFGVSFSTFFIESKQFVVALLENGRLVSGILS